MDVFPVLRLGIRWFGAWLHSASAVLSSIMARWLESTPTSNASFLLLPHSRFPLTGSIYLQLPRISLSSSSSFPLAEGLFYLPLSVGPFRSSLENSLDCIIPSRHEVPISGFQSIRHGELGLALNIINSRLKNFRSQVRNALVELGCRNRDVV